MESERSKSFPPIQKMSDDELRRYGKDSLIRLLRDVDAERLSCLKEHSKLMKTLNEHMQTHLMEVRGLKEVNKKLQEESQEVRDLVCFLDDDRQKGRKLAREWQRFGRYTSGVMKDELTSYQDKLVELEEKQKQVMQENMELKELCIYLDEDMKRFQRGDSIDRDDGDGSSSSSPIGEKIAEDAQATYGTTSYNRQTPALNEQTLQYIQQLEIQIQQMEQTRQPANTTTSVPTSRPESVMQAMRVLEIHERLEQPFARRIHQQDPVTRSEEAMDEVTLDDAEKAIVRQMCNVVWKKLGEA